MRSLLASIVTIGALATFASACTVQPELEEEEGTTSEAISAEICTVAAAAAEVTAGFAVRATVVATACVGGTLVTTAGTTTAACLVPATSAAASFLARLAVGAVLALACSSGTSEVVVGSGVSTAPVKYCPSGGRQTCSDRRYEDVRERKANACNRPRSCNNNMDCWTVQERITNGSECLEARDRVTNECCDGHSDAAHDAERRNVLTTFLNCRDRSLAACGW